MNDSLKPAYSLPPQQQAIRNKGFHPSILGDETYQTLLATMNNDELPANAFYGDGSPIEISVLHEFRRLYQQEAICFPWRKGDFLLLDNMLVAHGRRSFAGSRKTLVAMGEPVEATAQWGAPDAGAS